MTAGQTIDGVLREQLERFLVDMGTTDGRRRARKDLRALLDAPAVERKPFGWFRTPKDCPLQGMFLHYDPEHGERDIQNALDFGFTVKRLYETPVAQPQGEPVAWIKPDVAKTLRKDECCYAFGSQNPKGTLIPLYAEQPAPVAVVIPVRSPKDYAIEHAEYMAKSADDVMAKFQAYGLAIFAVDEGGDDGEGELLENIDSARGDLQESLVELRSMVYEFRKRAAESR